MKRYNVSKTSVSSTYKAHCMHQTKVLVCQLFVFDIVIFWRVVFLQTITHAVVVVPITEFFASIVIFLVHQTFVVLSIAGPTTVKQVQAQELALVLGFLFEYNC